MTKKLLFTLFAFFLLIINLIHGQNQEVLKNKHSKDSPNTFISARTSSPSQLTANIITYGYVASTTQMLDLTLNMTNNDQEYADSISITFPAGITPLNTPDVNFPTFDSDGGYSVYNGINGQTISWGENNNDLYGGVYGRNIHFKIAVSVGAISGVKTATFHLSGDGYTQINPTGNYDGTITISPKIPVDLRIINFFIPLVGCNNGTTEPIGIYLKNDGYNTANGGVTLTYKVNSNPTITETSTVNLGAGDTLFYSFNTVADFSALITYSAIGTISNSLDGNNSNNSKVEYSQTYPKNNLPYTSGFENTPLSDTLNWQREDNDSPQTWQLTTISPHSGTTCMRMLENSNVTSDDWLFSSCMNLETGKDYYVSYWSRLTSGYEGSLGVYVSADQNSYGITGTLKTLTPLIANDTWTKDSIPFTVSQNGVYHIGFEAANSTQTTIAVRLDDIKIAETNAIIGINDLLQDEISVYPNPTNGILNIYSPNSILAIDVYNMLGQSIYSTQTAYLGSNTINISNLEKGNYTIKCYNNRNLFYKKIIIE